MDVLGDFFRIPARLSANLGEGQVESVPKFDTGPHKVNLALQDGEYSSPRDNET
jgi:hypothetical protein